MILQIWCGGHAALREACEDINEVDDNLASNIIRFHRKLLEDIGGPDAINDAVLDAVARLVIRRATSASAAQVVLLRNISGIAKGSVATAVVLGSEPEGGSRMHNMSPLELQDLQQQALDRGDACKLSSIICFVFS